MYTGEHLVMSNPKGYLELGLKKPFRLNKAKRVLGFWVREASSRKETRKSMVSKGCLVRFVMCI